MTVRDLSPCAAIVRTADPVRFTAGLFADLEAREALFAILAFNQEIARVRGAVTQPLTGEIRLEWWREALREISAGARPRAHVVVSALGAAHARGRLSVDALLRVIDARSFDLYDEPMADEAALMVYAAATGGDLHAALAVAAGGDAKGIARAKTAGTAWALAGIVRMRAASGRQGPDLLPAEFSQRHALKAATDLCNDIKGVRLGAELPAVLPAVLIPRIAARLEKGAAYGSSAGGPLDRLRLAFAAARGRI